MLTPSAAISAGAQWRVDGGGWKNSGATVNNLSAGTHEVEFKAITGWLAPATTSASIVTGSTTTLAATYVQPAALQITLAPASGQWRIDGGAWRASGTTATGLTPASHSIEYAAVAGYTAPASETIALTAGQTTPLTRSYTQLASITVTLNPSWQMWRVDGGTIVASGATVGDLAPGSHTIDYFTNSGWAAPASETVTLTAGQALTLSRSGTQLAQLTVSYPVNAGYWRMNGGAWNAPTNGAMDIFPGTHAIEYSALGGWTAPPGETITATGGQSIVLNPAFVQLGGVTVALTPSSALWNIDGNAWQPSGNSWSNLTPGVHTVNYGAVAGYVTPAPESVTIVSGQTLAVSRAYVQFAQLAITLSPTNGQWRVNGGAWQASGAMTNLPPGNYTIEYSTLASPSWGTPPTETVSLSAGQSLAFARNYTQLGQVSIALVPSTGTWRLAGGAWQASGTTLWVQPGTYSLEYSPLEGYDPPASETFTGGIAATRYYTSTKPTLRMNLTPATAQWRVDGGAWQASGAQVTELAVGAHTIDYTDVGGDFNPLPSETISLAVRENAVLSRTYPSKPASVAMTLSPANAQWILAYGPTTVAWQTGNATVTGLTPGNYTIMYSTVAGYDAPPSEPITLAANQQAAVTRSYTAQPARVSLTLTPNSAQWRVYPILGSPTGPWNASGATVSGLPAGRYEIEYSTVPGHTKPDFHVFDLANGQELSLSASYTPIPPRIQGNLSPGTARFRINGGAWNLPDALVYLPAPGDYLVEFSPVQGYETPAPQTITLAWGDLRYLDVTYTPIPPGSMVVYTDPNSGQFRVDGGSWLSSGTLYNPISAGSHQIEFAPLAGYVTPAPVTLQIAPGENKTYTQQYVVGAATLSVVLTNNIGRWRVDGGAWLTSGGSVSFNSGSHFVEYEPVAGYVAPAAENLVLAADENRTLTRTYVVPTASMSVALTPTTGQWRIYSGAPSGSWNASGATVAGLTPGTYTIEYGALTGYTTPFPEPITLAPGDVRSLTRSYTPSTSGYAELVALPDLGSQAYLIRGSDAVLYGVTNTQGGNGGGTFFRTNPDGTGFTLLRSFPGYTNDGQNASALLESADGWLYGATQNGGSTVNRGTIFRTSRDGANYTLLRVFATAAEGLSPNTLLEASDGLLYGTTLNGGTSDVGVIFKMNKDGTGYTVLKHFNSMSVQGRYAARLTESADGGLYGTIRTGGANGVGLIYRLNKDGSGYALVKTFAGGADGASPQVALFRASDGLLYGSTSSGGTFNRGTAFRLNADGTGHLVLKNFAGDTSEGGAPATEFQESGGVLYGATSSGGSGSRGTVFKMNRDGTGFVTLKMFAGTPQEGGSMLWAPIVVGGGTINGASRLGGGANEGVIFRLGTDGSGFGVLNHLGAPNGSLLMTPVAEGSDGALYGTAYYGGLNREGTVFKVNKDGTGFAVLRQFSGLRSSFSQSVVSASDGLLYGVAVGSSGGEIYRLNPAGSGLTTIRSFATEVPESVIEGSDGVFYGISGGGTAGFGTVFKMNKDGTGYAILRSFLGGGTDGKYPSGILSEGPDGLLYGTTSTGGSADVGTIYRIAKDGSGYTVLRHFASSATDGAKPYAGVLFGSDGQLYGTTSVGGSTDNGVVYKISPNGSGFVVLRHFLGSAGNDGAGPSYAGVIEHNGTLYGTTAAGGAFSRGTLFKIGRDGAGYTTLINFGAGLTDGSVPAATLFRSSDGNLYGTTFRGGAGCVIFRFGPN